jgi:hypothetical protein
MKQKNYKGRHRVNRLIVLGTREAPQRKGTRKKIYHSDVLILTDSFVIKLAFAHTSQRVFIEYKYLRVWKTQNARSNKRSRVVCCPEVREFDVTRSKNKMWYFEPLSEQEILQLAEQNFEQLL